MEDSEIIGLFFERSEQAVEELDPAARKRMLTSIWNIRF